MSISHAEYERKDVASTTAKGSVATNNAAITPPSSRPPAASSPSLNTQIMPITLHRKDSRRPQSMAVTSSNSELNSKRRSGGLMPLSGLSTMSQALAAVKLHSSSDV